VQPHPRFVLAEQLCHIDALEESIERIGAEIAQRLAPQEEIVTRLQMIPGVGRRTAEGLPAEIGDRQ
jgi:transposase